MEKFSLGDSYSIQEISIGSNRLTLIENQKKEKILFLFMLRVRGRL